LTIFCLFLLLPNEQRIFPENETGVSECFFISISSAAASFLRLINDNNKNSTAATTTTMATASNHRYEVSCNS